MIRTLLVFIYVFGFAAYAWRSWFVSLCALIFLNAVNLHPDMPRAMLGIPGFKPWNILLLGVLVAWIAKRGEERLRFNAPPAMALVTVAYFAVFLVAWLRMFYDREFLVGVTASDLINDVLINSIKWVIPGLLLFDGARTEWRQKFALFTICAVYVVFAVQVLKWMPPWLIASGDELQKRSIKLIEKEMGYSRVNMSMMLAGGSWALLCVRDLFQSPWLRRLAFLAFLAIALAQAMTGGRMGYVTWGTLGLFLSAVRWRRFLVLGPTLVILIVSFVPAVRERALQGVTTADDPGESVEVDRAQLTSDRTIIWPAVIEKIGENPIVGYGLFAMQRTGLSASFGNLAFPHPHNAYLEVLLDAGIVGLLPVILFFVMVLARGGALFIFWRTPVERAAGSVALVLTLSLLIAAFGSQHFVPQEGGVGMWAAIGLMMRLSVERSRRPRRAVAPAPARQPQAVAR